MKNGMTSFVTKAALFLFVANLVMLFIVPTGTAEWYVTLLSLGLMAILIVSILLIGNCKKRRKDKKDI